MPVARVRVCRRALEGLTCPECTRTHIAPPRCTGKVREICGRKGFLPCAWTRVGNMGSTPTKTTGGCLSKLLKTWNQRFLFLCRLVVAHTQLGIGCAQHTVRQFSCFGYSQDHWPLQVHFGFSICFQWECDVFCRQSVENHTRMVNLHAPSERCLDLDTAWYVLVSGAVFWERLGMNGVCFWTRCCQNPSFKPCPETIVRIQRI